MSQAQNQKHKLSDQQLQYTAKCIAMVVRNAAVTYWEMVSALFRSFILLLTNHSVRGIVMAEA